MLGLLQLFIKKRIDGGSIWIINNVNICYKNLMAKSFADITSCRRQRPVHLSIDATKEHNAITCWGCIIFDISWNCGPCHKISIESYICPIQIQNITLSFRVLDYAPIYASSNHIYESINAGYIIYLWHMQYQPYFLVVSS